MFFMRGVGRLKYSVFDERLKNKTLLSRKIVKSRATDDFILICQVLLMQTVPGFDLFEPIDVLVLGVGNILWADEGFGPRAAEAFHQRYPIVAFACIGSVDIQAFSSAGG